MSATEQHRAAKLRRITRACDYCHQRSIRCAGGSATTPCHNCIAFRQPCTYNREAKVRGVKRKQTIVPRNLAPITLQNSTQVNVANDDGPQPWRAPYVASQAVVMDLVEIYFEIVYPIFPLFHRPTYIRKISRGDYNTDNNLFAATMAVCSLVSARVRDRALFNPSWDVHELSQVRSETFYDASIQACTPNDHEQPQDLNVLRAYSLLALTAIQYGRIREMQAHLGHYHTMVAMDGLHDESNWPKSLGIVETEERRRLFWSMYTLEIYTSIVWNGVTRLREQQINVAYTAEIDDEFFSDRGFNQRNDSTAEVGLTPGNRWGEVGSSSWICGWNFTTDLYRIMEHVVTNFRGRHRHRRTLLGEMFGRKDMASGSSVRESVMRLYSNLPPCFKECPQITCDPARDRYGFQAANITATVQLLRMLLFSADGGSIEERCKVATEVVDAFSNIPVAYLQATSSPLQHHLAGIGMILGAVFEEPLGEAAYQQVRAVLLALSQVLENLDYGVRSTNSAQRLRNLVAQIDDYMGAQPAQYQNNEETDSQTRTDAQHGELRNDERPSFLQTIPPQMMTGLFGDWPWSFDFTQLSESWPSVDELPDHTHDGTYG